MWGENLFANFANFANIVNFANFDSLDGFEWAEGNGKLGEGEGAHGEG